MILPVDVKSKRHKVRDAQICLYYIRNDPTLDDLSSKFGLTASRCQQILYENTSLLKRDKDYEKTTRVNHLKRLLRLHPDSLGKKGTVDLIEQLRKEIEGEKPLVDNSKHQYFTVFRNPDAIKEELTTERNTSQLQAR